MNMRALKALADGAEAWAKAHVAVYDQLIRRGVPEGDARSVATAAAGMAAAQRAEEEPKPEDFLG